MTKKYRGYLYLLLSIYILIQTTIFPQKPAELLIYFFRPELNGKSVIFSPHDHVIYLNIIVYFGLALSGSLFFKAANTISQSFLKKNEGVIKYIDLATALTTTILIFLCTVKVYHLFQRENIGLFSISGETAATLVALLICVVFNFLRKREKDLHEHSLE
jgi:hypothetical protein